MNKDNENQSETFESALSKLEGLTKIFSESNVPLEESVKLYEQADSLIEFCETSLAKAESRMSAIDQKRLDREQQSNNKLS